MDSNFTVTTFENIESQADQRREDVHLQENQSPARALRMRSTFAAGRIGQRGGGVENGGAAASRRW